VKVNSENIKVTEVLQNFIDWFVESSMILSGYTHTASATMSSKYVSEKNHAGVDC
jgi:hypothetical protein